jgi:hypothetical protein
LETTLERRVIEDEQWEGDEDEDEDEGEWEWVLLYEMCRVHACECLMLNRVGSFIVDLHTVYVPYCTEDVQYRHYVNRT